MNMRYILALLLLTIFPASSFSQEEENWIYATKSITGDSYYIHKDIKKQGSNYLAWVSTEYERVDEENDDPYDETLILYEFSPDLVRYRMLQIIWKYEGDVKNLYNCNDREWSYVAPESVLEGAVDVLKELTSNTKAVKTNRRESGMVYVCNGTKSYRFHKNRNCKGLNQCRSTVSTMANSEARSKGYTPCRICY